MRQIEFIRSNTFLWTAAVAATLALFVAGLFAFIYWKIDDYLIMRSDRMIATQLNFLADMTKGPDTLWDAPGMQRIKIPFGGVTPDQLDTLADLSEEYADAVLHAMTISLTPCSMRKSAAMRE